MSLICLAGLSLLSGCGTAGDVFGLSSHVKRAEDYRAAIASGNTARIQSVAEDLEGRVDGNDRILYLMERGRLNQVAGDLDASVRDYQEASDRFEEVRMKPTLSATDAFFNAGALATNDLAIPYEGYGYEKVMVHNLQALNYLKLGNAEFARVELNRADLEQQFALDQHQKLVAKSENEARQSGIGSSEVKSATSEASLDLGYAAGSIKNSFQNAYTFYLSAVLFEILGDPNRALIDYGRALEIYPSNSEIAADALRLARKENDARAIERFEALARSKADMPGDDEGRVVILFENGFIQPRSEIRIPWIFARTIQQIVLPYYADRPRAPVGAEILTDGRPAARTELIADLDVMAVQALKERYTAILIRQVLRVLAKREASYQAQQGAGNEGDLVALGFSIYNIMTDQADTRTWLTLPADLQVATVYLPEGRHEISARHTGSNTQSLSVRIQPGETTILLLRRAGSRLALEQVYPSSDQYLPSTLEPKTSQATKS